MHTERFTGRAHAYAVARPAPPQPAIDFVLAGLGDPTLLHIADIGSGTGLSARAFAGSGAQVFAIEPNASMRAAATPHARVTSVIGSAEETTLADSSVDVAVACGAWHWFDHAAVGSEIRRILTTPGRLGILELPYDEDDPCTKGWRDVVRQFESAAPRMPLFADEQIRALQPAHIERIDVPFAHEFDRAGLHVYTDSDSKTPAAGSAYDALHAAVDALVDRFGSPARISLKRRCRVARINV